MMWAVRQLDRLKSVQHQYTNKCFSRDVAHVAHAVFPEPWFCRGFYFSREDDFS